MMEAVPWMRPLYCGFGRFASSMSLVLDKSTTNTCRKKKGLNEKWKKHTLLFLRALQQKWPPSYPLPDPLKDKAITSKPTNCGRRDYHTQQTP
jgi:hypothetical protein